MKLIKASLERPIAIVSVIFMTIILGIVAFERIPIQIAPDVNKPVISITTYWFGASPYEMEREIVNRQEESLKGIEGVTKITATTREGRSVVTLEFDVTADMGKSLLLVSNKLNQIEGYPDDAGEPTIDTAGLDDNAIAWFIVTKTEGNIKNIAAYGDVVEDIIQDRIERVSGVARTNAYGSSETELRITIDPVKMAYFGLTVPYVVETIRNANSSISAGDVEEGKRKYIVRAEGEINSEKQVKDIVLISEQDSTGRYGRVTVSDIANVEFTFKEPRAVIRFLGQSSIAINAVRETGANVIEVMDEIKQTLAELNNNVLPELGLKIEQVYDETIYIDSAVNLVTQNIWIGGALAIIILLIFLRSWQSTIVIAISIPISIVAAFVAMALLGKSINVISLAGIAFAVGMVVDAAIVVLENIYRVKEKGESNKNASFIGTSQVWQAVMVSALTTVLVFIPILIMELEAGQLFQDIAVAISVAVLMSLLVSITILPALTNWILNFKDTKYFSIPIADNFGKKITNLILDYVSYAVNSKKFSFILVCSLISSTLFLSYIMLPKLEYLPEGNRNLIFGVMLPPPGYNLKTLTDIAESVENKVKHLWASETGSKSEKNQPPKIDNYFFVAGAGDRTLFGASAVEETRVKELIPVMSSSLLGEPATFGFFTQPGLFVRGYGGGRSIDLNVIGSDLNNITSVAQQAAGLVFKEFPRKDGNQLRPKPGLILGAPEIQVQPNRIKLADNNVTAEQLALGIDAFNSGLRVDEIIVNSKRMDLTLMGQENAIKETQGIENIPIVTNDGKIIPVSSLSNIIYTTGPTQIRHIEGERAVTLQIKPADNIALEEAIERIESKVVNVLENNGLPPDISLDISGTADELTTTWKAMSINLIVAVFMVYLLMTILFESFRYPFIIMLSVPPAAAGGVLGLFILNLKSFQALDMLTMLGFVILSGIVVNNAILLVHRTLQVLKNQKKDINNAIIEATQNRIRPIFMSTLTSVFGMLPLVMFPGAGSELYKGLGSVVVGGLSLSAILTLLIIPPMLKLFLKE
ncbi:MAG: efflux RND transporter permease subunit [Rickettsiales bacterium TMED254]|nr:acriflavin resistance protein [Rickettsiales bacterium]RPF76359.1 MAG: efflux RND transporter permease subunit [Rickettsiales bacterium TMED254]